MVASLGSDHGPHGAQASVAAALDSAVGAPRLQITGP